MILSEALVRVQAAYPRIYLACHTRHQNARTTPHKLSQRDATLLAHLDENSPLPQRLLARHVGVAKSTLSEALSGLEDLGYIRRTASGRAAVLVRTKLGTQAMSQGSVLESERLGRLLLALNVSQRRRAVEGLELLANASRKMEKAK